MHLAEWAYEFRRPAYVAVFDRAIKGLAPPDAHTDYRFEAMSLLSLVDLASSPEGRKRLGIKEEDIGIDGRISWFADLNAAKTDCLRAERALWASLQGPIPGRVGAAVGADKVVREALSPIPPAARIYAQLRDGTGELARHLWFWQAQHDQFVALSRALHAPTIPASIRTDDLRSPKDGSPLHYTYADGRITIEVSGGTALEFPPSAPPQGA